MACGEADTARNPLRYGHTAQLSTCVDAAVAAYLVSLVTPPVGSVCAQDVGPFDAQPGSSVEAAVNTAIALSGLPEAMAVGGE